MERDVNINARRKRNAVITDDEIDDPAQCKKETARKVWAERRELRLREKRLYPPR